MFKIGKLMVITGGILGWIVAFLSVISEDIARCWINRGASGLLLSGWSGIIFSTVTIVLGILLWYMSSIKVSGIAILWTSLGIITGETFSGIFLLLSLAGALIVTIIIKHGDDSLYPSKFNINYTSVKT